jgi:hypothetical protein
MRCRLSSCLAVAGFVSGIAWGAAALAEDPPAAPSPAVKREMLSVEAYGGRHAECLAWSDGCVTCARGAGTPNCSTPGIACLPGETVCKETKKP